MKDMKQNSKNSISKNKNIVIKVKNLKKSYGKKVIFENFNLTIRKGERVAFVAANGVGKSTLMEIIAQIKPINGGEVYLDSRAKLGIQFQDSNYPHGITVKNMINFYLDIYRIKLTKKMLDKELEFFQLKDLFKKQIVFLSGGEKQRVNLFLALCNNPDIWFLDEITTGLDIKFRSIILRYIDQLLTKDKTLLLVSHNSFEISQLCNRLIVLDLNTLICDISNEKIKSIFGSIEIFVEYFFNNIGNRSPLEKKRIIKSFIDGKKKFIRSSIKKTDFFSSKK